MVEKTIVRETFILSNKLKRLLEKRYSKYGLFSGQARILMYLYRKKDERIYQKDIEQAYQIRGGTVSGLLDNLESNGYINRVSSEIDKRKKLIVLTDKGKEISFKSINMVNSFEEEVLKLLTKNEIDAFYSINKKLNKYIDEEELYEKTI